MSSEKPVIMVVEDEALLLRAITKELQVMGFESLSCTTARQALEYLEKVDELPDAIWLDYYLKDMNGLVFMQELRQNPAWQAIPVIVVSNSANREKVNTMLALGVKKYILKAEYHLDEIIKMVREFIKDNK